MSDRTSEFEHLYSLFSKSTNSKKYKDSETGFETTDCGYDDTCDVSMAVAKNPFKSRVIRFSSSPFILQAAAMVIPVTVMSHASITVPNFITVVHCILIVLLRQLARLEGVNRMLSVCYDDYVGFHR